MNYLRKSFIVPSLFLLFVTAGTLAAQDPPFEIEDWEKGINERQPPAEILDAIGAGPGMVIGEVGAGTGRMTLWLAWRVGGSGRVYANDINEESLDHLRKRAKNEGFANIEVVVGEENDPRLPGGVLDIAFMINVYHHLEDPIPLLRNILPSLKPGGCLAIVECDPAKVSWGKDHNCSSREKMRKDLQEAGYEMVKIDTFLNEDNIYIARPVRK
jgi:ubiquinone/menaquinone biosynthesis C-methylase UbiE